MNLQQKNLWIVLAVCLLLTVATPVFFPLLRIQFFSAFLVILLYNKPLIKCLWASLWCGCVLDLLSSQNHLGLHALTFTVTTWIFFSQRRHFFADSLSTLPLMTFLFSLVSTTLQTLQLAVFEHHLHLTKTWLLTDLLLFPLMDALYAFCFFVLPFYLFGTPIRKGKDYFMDKRN